MTTEFIDELRSLSNQAFISAECGRLALVLGSFNSHNAHGWERSRSGYRLCIGPNVLLSLEEGLVEGLLGDAVPHGNVAGPPSPSDERLFKAS